MFSPISSQISSYHHHIFKFFAWMKLIHRQYKPRLLLHHNSNDPIIFEWVFLGSFWDDQLWRLVEWMAIERIISFFQECHRKLVPRLEVASLNLFFFFPASLGNNGTERNSCSMILSMILGIFVGLTAVLGRHTVRKTPNHSNYAQYTAARLNKRITKQVNMFRFLFMVFLAMSCKARGSLL